MVHQTFDKKVALITGASSGIGRELAIQFARHNIHVILLARRQRKLERLYDKIEAAGGSATIMPVDLENTEDLAQIGALILKKFGRLDILILAAAQCGEASPFVQKSLSNVVQITTVNFTANLQLLRSLDGALRLGQKADIVFFDDKNTAQKPFFGAYNASKAALISMAKSYQREVQHSSINIHLYDPGPVNTKLRENAYPGEEKSELKTAEHAAEEVCKLLDLNAANLKKAS